MMHAQALASNPLSDNPFAPAGPQPPPKSARSDQPAFGPYPRAAAARQPSESIPGHTDRPSLPDRSRSTGQAGRCQSHFLGHGSRPPRWTGSLTPSPQPPRPPVPAGSEAASKAPDSARRDAVTHLNGAEVQGPGRRTSADSAQRGMGGARSRTHARGPSHRAVCLRTPDAKAGPAMRRPISATRTTPRSAWSWPGPTQEACRPSEAEPTCACGPV
jgi:hypothetical protein